MKTTLLSLAMLLIASVGIQAQTDVYLNINHKMGISPFAFNVPSMNNMGHDVKFSRLEYYVSDIAITHDGGQVTEASDTWLLVDAGDDLYVNLGNFDVVSIEAISFFVGVGPDVNHEDPTAWPSDHPLAPQNPSMHWGWSAGYRFIALEGVGGMNLNQAVELHGLGDPNYFQQEIDLDVQAVSGIAVIDLDADYLRSVENISLSSGAITHGDYGDAKECLENMRDYVFSPAGSVVSVDDLDISSELKVYPNPSTDGTFWVNCIIGSDSTYDLKVIDALGKTVFAETSLTGQSMEQVEGLAAGMYTVILLDANGILSSAKASVK